MCVSVQQQVAEVEAGRKTLIAGVQGVGAQVRQFESATQAVEWLREHGHARAALAGISAMCNSQKRTAYGYSWRFADR